MSTRTLPSPVAAAGDYLLDLLAGAGRFALFLARFLREFPRGMRSRRLVLRQCYLIGNESLPLVFLTSIFVGGVAALQSSYQLQGAIPLMYVGTLLAKSVFIELGPVLTALVVGARVGASIAAEIGSMKVTEQVDALETLAIQPVRYLAVPRFIGAVVMLPVITVFANAIAIVGGMSVAVARVGISTHTFTRGMRFMFDPHDVYGGLIKSFVFGAIIAISGCYYGFTTSGGAEGVGTATMKAVVACCVMILVADYFLAEVIFRILFATG